MRRRFLSLGVGWATAGFVVLGSVATLTGQTERTASAKGPGDAPAAKGWKVPRTPDGHPDLQGVWDFRSLTPLERPSALGEKQVFSDEEAAEFTQAQIADIEARDTRVPDDIVGNYNQFWFDRGSTIVGTKRTSLIVDPPDGRLPPLTPAGEKRQAAVREARKGTGRHEPTPGGWVEDLGPGGLQVRCILGFNSGPPVTPSGYNNNLQIFQSANSVAVLNEMVHNARIVPIDGRPHLPQRLRQWVGDSRGRWEGDTLVVETTNFLRETAFVQGGTTSSLHLVERFRRTGPDTLMYEFTVNDPNVWTKPWTAQVLMARNPEPMYEYACHEGNYGLANILAGAKPKEGTKDRGSRTRP